MDENQVIEKLKEESEAHKRALQSELSGIVNRSKKVALRVVLIGGGLALAYLISKRFLGDSKKTPSKESELPVFSMMKGFILRELSVFLLGLAKERLVNYLDQTKTDEEINS